MSTRQNNNSNNKDSELAIYFAPLEGITNYLFRQIYHRHYDGIDRYYSPFVTTRDGGFMKKKEKGDVLPENNTGINLIPQILSNHAEGFCQTARHMEDLGYSEVNLNLGCPSGTVTSKKRGAGFLLFPDELNRFLDHIFTHSPISISIKSRIGFYAEEEFYRLLDIYNQYPVKELILHLRTRTDMYQAPVHREIFSYAEKHSHIPLCYNGDVTSIQDLEDLKKDFPALSAVMIGRGFLRYPGFTADHHQPLNSNKLYDFVTELCQSYCEHFSGETPVLFKMKELWSYLKDSVPDGDKFFHKIKKTKKLSEYKQIVKEQLV